jgi:hypothetical protein
MPVLNIINTTVSSLVQRHQTKVSMSVRLFYNNNNGNTHKQEIQNIQGFPDSAAARETSAVSVEEACYSLA